MLSEITLHLYDGEQHELMHGLHRGRFDWRWSTIWSSAIRSIKNGSMPRITLRAAAAAHPLAQKAQVTLQELSREPMILPMRSPVKIILSHL